MKRQPSSPLLILTCIAALPIALLADSENSLAAFAMGKKHFELGEYKEARHHLLLAIKEDPKNKQAQDYLRHVQAAAKHGIKPANLEAKLRSVTVRQVKFENLAIEDALAYLKVKVAESTGDQLKANFILKGKSDAAVTLDLGDLPASEVLRYIAELSGYRVSYDPHAIVLSKHDEK